MNTMLRSSNAPQQQALAPSMNATGRPPVSGGGVHKGVWIGGGLMALTIVALATALVVKSSGSGSESIAPVTAAAPLTPDPAAATATTVAQAPVVAPAPAPVVAPTPVPAPAPAPVVHHRAVTHPAPVYTERQAPANENTRVADAGGNNNANAAPAYTEPARVAPPVCTSCGTIESFDPVKVEGQTNGIGAVGGGVIGAVAGSKIAGRNNHTLGGVLGAIGGGLLGNEVEKNQRESTAYDVHVRMDDGSMRTVRQSTAPVLGEKVSVNGNSLSARAGNGASGYASPSYPNGGSSNYSSQQQGGNGAQFSPSGN